MKWPRNLGCRLIHPGGRFTEQSKMEFGRPYLLDEVARTFPKLRLVIAQMGQPWVDETLCLANTRTFTPT